VSKHSFKIRVIVVYSFVLTINVNVGISTDVNESGSLLPHQLCSICSLESLFWTCHFNVSLKNNKKKKKEKEMEKTTLFPSLCYADSIFDTVTLYLNCCRYEDVSRIKKWHQKLEMLINL